MTDDDADRFDQTFNRLSMAFQHTPDEGEKDVYYDALCYLPVQAVEDAANKIARDGSSFFPKTSDWCDQADHLAAESSQRLFDQEQHRLLPAPMVKDAHARAVLARAKFLKELRERPANGKVDFAKVADTWERAFPVTKRPWKHGCDVCQDSGYVSRFCDAQSRCRAHNYDDPVYDHDYVEACNCRPTNPVIQRRLELAMSRRQKPMRKGQ